MELSLQPKELAQYVSRQLQVFFPDGKSDGYKELCKHMNDVLQRVECCFSKVNNRYFYHEGQVQFSHLHGDQYAMFLYYAANTLFRKGCDSGICTKLFQLNRYLHGLDAYYEVELPDVFLLVHPLGTVLGRGSYSDYFLVYQRCGVGSNHDIYPSLGKHVTLRPGASVLGNCQVGERCTLAAGALLLDRDLSEGTVYIGDPRSHCLKTQLTPIEIWR